MTQRLTDSTLSVAITMALVLLLSHGCKPTSNPSEPIEPDLVHTVQEHGVTVTITLSPATMDPRRDVLLALQTRFPPGIQVIFPEPATALEGFSIAATFTLPETRDQDGYRTRKTELRLTPIPGATYRIAPMLFELPDQTASTAASQYLLTPTILPNLARNHPAADATLTTQLTPVYIPPTMAEMARILGIALLAVAVLTAIYLLARKLKRRIQILRMSPSERARYALQQLLEKDLPGKGQYKEFYFAITGIIRTYIERRHRIRAPELTTPEFLAAAAARPAFSPAVVARLKSFLEAADLVKFAAWTPTQQTIQNTIDTARDYIEQDEPTHHQEEN